MEIEFVKEEKSLPEIELGDLLVSDDQGLFLVVEDTSQGLNNTELPLMLVDIVNFTVRRRWNSLEVVSGLPWIKEVIKNDKLHLTIESVR